MTEYLTVVLLSNPNISEEVKEKVENIKGEQSMLTANINKGIKIIKKNAYK